MFRTKFSLSVLNGFFFAGLLLAAFTGIVSADDFTDLSAGFGTTLTLAGLAHATTTDANGISINFWTNTYEGAVASTVSLSNPHMAGADAYGNVFIADKSGQAVLKITTNGLIHTFAGTHVGGFNGDGPAPATSLQLSNVNGLFVFPNGTVYLLDPGNHRIRCVTTNGQMTTIVNDLTTNWYPSGRALWVSPDEQLIYYTHEFAPVGTNIIADGATIKKWTTTNGIETVCSKAVGFRNPANCAVNPVDGKLYICDRAEEDTTKIATGLFRIDGPDLRTRITGNISSPIIDSGQLALNSFLDQPRGLAFRLVETLGVLPRDQVIEEMKSLPQEDRSKLRVLGARFGAFHIFVPVLLKPAATRESAERSRLFAALGHDGENTAAVGATDFGIAGGDVFLLCTDGFWEYIDETAMEASLVTAVSAADWLRLMEDQVRTRGGPEQDNFSALAIWCTDLERARSPAPV